MESPRRPPQGETGSGRILVFVVAYEAERHLVSVFERIPKEIFADPAVHVLCIDDASNDRSAELLIEWVHQQGLEDRVTVLRIPVNQGYGGNQKLGYRMAVNRGYDLVILLHGDGQYAPELLPEIIATWRNGGADVILGSRMLEPGGARRGGMPLYKWVGNRVLTTFQNRLTGESLSEYHTGYRAYTTRFLSSVPFEMNTNDFHFDTDILLQAAHVDARIVEIPIPTRYGDEECRVPGLRYSKDVVGSTIRFKLHQMGMLCNLKLRHLKPLRYQTRQPFHTLPTQWRWKRFRKWRPAAYSSLEAVPALSRRSVSRTESVSRRSIASLHCREAISSSSPRTSIVTSCPSIRVTTTVCCCWT